MIIKTPTIHAQQLSLVPLQPADAGILHRIYQSDGVLRYFPNPQPPPLEKVESFVFSQQKHWEQFGYGNWGILLTGETQIIGWAGLQYLPELKETEVGFLLDRPFWGKGLATEAAHNSLKFGFENFDLDHMIALVHPENIASRHVIEKCGLVYLETISLWGLDLLRYRIEREKFNDKLNLSTHHP